MIEVEDLDLSDVKLIINKLITFIVIEGETFVTKEEKDNYVKGYLNLLINVINKPGQNRGNANAILMDRIFKDISNYKE